MTPCLPGASPVVFGVAHDMAAQLREVPSAASVVCGDDRSQIHHNPLCDRIRTFPATMVNGRLHEGFRTAAELESLCRSAGSAGPANSQPRDDVRFAPPVCNVPRVRSRFPTGSFLNPSWDAASATRALFR